MIKSGFFFIAFPMLCYAASIGIYNDSPFKLRAEIVSATGDYVGQISISPQDYDRWEDTTLTDTASGSMTPFTILFTCTDGEEYGIATLVPTGATINAQSSQGRKFCKVQKPREQSGSPSTPRELPSSAW